SCIPTCIQNASRLAMRVLRSRAGCCPSPVWPFRAPEARKDKTVPRGLRLESTTRAPGSHESSAIGRKDARACQGRSSAVNVLELPLQGRCAPATARADLEVGGPSYLNANVTDLLCPDSATVAVAL